MTKTTMILSQNNFFLFFFVFVFFHLKQKEIQILFYVLIGNFLSQSLDYNLDPSAQKVRIHLFHSACVEASLKAQIQAWPKIFLSWRKVGVLTHQIPNHTKVNSDRAKVEAIVAKLEL